MMGWKAEMREKSLCEYINECVMSKEQWTAVGQWKPLYQGKTIPHQVTVRGQASTPPHSLLFNTLPPFIVLGLPTSMPLLFAHIVPSPAMPLSLQAYLYEVHPTL